MVTRVGPMNDDVDFWINGGFFALRPGDLRRNREGDELVEQPFQRLIEQGKLVTYRHDGFWQSMDTFKDKIIFDRMEAQRQLPVDGVALSMKERAGFCPGPRSPTRRGPLEILCIGAHCDDIEIGCGGDAAAPG